MATKPNNSAQSRLDRLIAEWGSPVAIANLQKQLWISVNPNQNSTVTTPTAQNQPSTLTADQQAFEEGWKGYSDASKGVYDIETTRTIDTYDQQRKANDLVAARNREDYARYTSDAQTSTNRQLASSSKEFSRKLASAAQAYGQRGLLRSGIAKRQIWEATGDFSGDQTYFKTQAQRQLEAGQQQYDRNYADTQTAQGNLATKKSQYETDRNAGRQILDTQLQYEWDTQYNQQKTNQWTTEQEKLRQDAKNRAAWITSTPTLRTWRVRGNYTSQ